MLLEDSVGNKETANHCMNTTLRVRGGGTLNRKNNVPDTFF